MNNVEETVLITGASSGFGVEFARQLLTHSRTLVLVARRIDRLESLKKELLALKPGVEIHCRQVDLQNSIETEQLVTWLKAQNLEVSCLVNNAGLGDVGNFGSSEWSRTEAMLNVNMSALTRLTFALLPGMIARGRGRILNIGSIAGYLALPGFAVYAASKAYVNSFSEALYWELQGTGVVVTAVCPGPVQTEFLEVATRNKGKKSFDAPKCVEVSVTEVVRLSLAGVNQAKPRVVPGLGIWLASTFLSKLPMWWMRILYKFKVITAP